MFGAAKFEPQDSGGATVDPQRRPAPALFPLSLAGPSGCAFPPRPKKKLGWGWRSESRNCSFSELAMFHQLSI